VKTHFGGADGTLDTGRLLAAITPVDGGGGARNPNAPRSLAVSRSPSVSVETLTRKRGGLRKFETESWRAELKYEE
jgi:hypothetical protein